MYMLNPYICYSTSSVVSVMRGISTLENGRRKKGFGTISANVVSKSRGTFFKQVSYY